LCCGTFRRLKLSWRASATGVNTELRNIVVSLRATVVSLVITYGGRNTRTIIHAQNLQNAARNHRCSSSKLSHASAAARSWGIVSHHARANPFNTATCCHLQARFECDRARSWMHRHRPFTLAADVSSSALAIAAVAAYTCCYTLPQAFDIANGKIALASAAAAAVCESQPSDAEWYNILTQMCDTKTIEFLHSLMNQIICAENLYRLRRTPKELFSKSFVVITRAAGGGWGLGMQRVF